MPQPGERRAVRLFADACHECWRVVQDPVLKRPGASPRFARALAMMAQIGEPDVEPGGAEKVREPCVQPEPMIRKRAMDQEHRGAAIAIGTQPVQRELDPVGRRQPARGSAFRHSYRPAARYASSSSSTGWRARAAMPAAASPAPICM